MPRQGRPHRSIVDARTQNRKGSGRRRRRRRRRHKTSTAKKRWHRHSNPFLWVVTAREVAEGVPKGVVVVAPEVSWLPLYRASLFPLLLLGFPLGSSFPSLHRLKKSCNATSRPIQDSFDVPAPPPPPRGWSTLDSLLPLRKRRKHSVVDPLAPPTPIPACLPAASYPTLPTAEDHSK